MLEFTDEEIELLNEVMSYTDMAWNTDLTAARKRERREPELVETIEERYAALVELKAKINTEAIKRNPDF